MYQRVVQRGIEFIKRLRSHVRVFVEPAQYAAMLSRARAREAVGSPPPIRLLLISDNVTYGSEQQFAPIHRWAGSLCSRLGVTVRCARLERAQRWPPAAFEQFDGVGLKMTWQTPDAQAIETASHFHRNLTRSGIPFAYFDGDDDLTIQWPRVASLVCLHVKKHVFAERACYMRGYVGKTNLTDMVASTYGWSFADDPIPKTDPLPREFVGKIHVGWNIALDDKIFRLVRRMERRPPLAKDTDVVCRASVPDDWIRPLREQLLARLVTMGRRFNVLAPSQRVSQKQYTLEMLRSRICVSPFGYGEICWRDFEAITSGCLLVKPDMSHIETRPNLFIPGQTYVPVQWDYADLEETCARYLSDDAARNRIVNEAQRTLAAASSVDWFVAVFEELLRAWLREGLSRRVPAESEGAK